MAQTRQKRRVRIVHGGIQWGIFRVVVVGITASVIISSAVIFKLLVFLRTVLAEVPDARLDYLLDQAVETIALTVMIQLIIVALGGLYGLYMSHRIAGPIYRVEKDLERMEVEGETFEIRIRNGDMIAGLVERLNRLLSRLGGMK